MNRRSTLASRLITPCIAAAALLAAGLGSASAQQPTPKPPAKPATSAKPAAKPAAPPVQAQAGPPGPGQAIQPTGLVAFPWMKVCGDDPNLKKQVCRIEQNIIADTGPFIVGFGLLEVKDDPKKAFVAAFPTGLSVLLREGFRVSIGSEPPQTGTFAVCNEKMCQGDLAVDADFVNRMRKAQTLTLQVANGSGRWVPYQLSLADFGKTYDGAPTDLKAYEEQVKQIYANVKDRRQTLAAEAQQREQATKEGLEKLGAEKLKSGAAPTP